VHGEIVQAFDVPADKILCASGKTGLGMETVLPAVIERIPPPRGAHPTWLCSVPVTIKWAWHLICQLTPSDIILELGCEHAITTVWILHPASMQSCSMQAWAALSLACRQHSSCKLQSVEFFASAVMTVCTLK
jgi:hypothetical protein